MLRDPSNHQTVLDFCLPFEGELNPKNRWVVLADAIPWDDLGAIYNKSFESSTGPPAKRSRVVLGALILKHLKKLSDEATIEEIRENPYYQYFLGFSEFKDRRVFVPSLFVEIRKRLGLENLQKINELFLSQVEESPKKTKRASGEESEEMDTSGNNTSDNSDEPPKHKGMLIIDATVAPADIKYPTDVSLLNKAREYSEGIIDQLWGLSKGGVKPRTYRRKARKQYLAYTHQGAKRNRRKAVSQQLSYLRRNIKHIHGLLGMSKEGHYPPFPLSYKDQRQLMIIIELYRQQKIMYDERLIRIQGRLVSLSQPHVRPIVRGKAGKKTEFGAKISGVVIDGYTHLDHLSWEAYNESSDLIPAVEKFKERNGVYPASVNADKIYWNRANRKYLKEKSITLYGASPLGRPRKKETLSSDEKRKKREESNKRNHIEGKFGEGKRRYGLGLVMTKLRDTSESWIAMVIVIMNIARYWRDLIFYSFLYGMRFSFYRGLRISKQISSIYGYERMVFDNTFILNNPNKLTC